MNGNFVSFFPCIFKILSEFPSLRYASLNDHMTEEIVGSTDKQPLLETPGEVPDG